MNYFVIPIIYKGSCFDDIAQGILKSAKKNKVVLKHLSFSYGEIKGGGLENPDEYFSDSIKKLTYLGKVLRNGDKVLFMDYFCPGLDLINYYLERNNISVYKVALIHGATFVDGDIYQEFKWLKDFENGWISVYDKIISPSKFFLKNLPADQRSKFAVHPWGLDEGIKPSFDNKLYDVIFPHRLSRDKGIEDLIELIKKLPDISFCMTGLNKDVAKNSCSENREYIKKLERLKNLTIIGIEDPRAHLSRLKKSKIVFSAALQEGFGFAVMKSIQCGNIPVLPNRCCYPEFFPKKFRYNSISEACGMIRNFVSTYPKHYYKLDLSEFTYSHVINYFKD